MVTSLSQGNIKGRGDNKDKRGGRGEEKSKKTKRRKFLKRKFPGVERGVGKSFFSYVGSFFIVINLKNLMFPCDGHLNYVLAPPFRDPSLGIVP
jgi:hypothetical protein